MSQQAGLQPLFTLELFATLIAIDSPLTSGSKRFHLCVLSVVYTRPPEKQSIVTAPSPCLTLNMKTKSFVFTSVSADG